MLRVIIYLFACKRLYWKTDLLQESKTKNLVARPERAYFNSDGIIRKRKYFSRFRRDSNGTCVKLLLCNHRVIKWLVWMTHWKRKTFLRRHWSCIMVLFFGLFSFCKRDASNIKLKLELIICFPLVFFKVVNFRLAFILNRAIFLIFYLKYHRSFLWFRKKLIRQKLV